VRLAEIAPVVEHIHDERAQRRDAQSAGDYQEIIALKNSYRKSFAERSPYVDLISCLQCMQASRNFTDRPDTEIKGLTSSGR
jgi:hypothetical protein